MAVGKHRRRAEHDQSNRRQSDQFHSASPKPLLRDSATWASRHYRLSGYASGRRIVARNPPSEDEPSAIDPPYNSTRSATIARPRPDPGAASSARTPRCSTVSLNSGANPGPSSSTVRTTDPSVVAERTSTRV